MGILGLLGAVLCAGVGGVIAWHISRRLRTTAPLIVGMALQAVVAIGLYLVVGLWAPDAIKYDQMGQELAASWQGGPSPTTQIGDGKEGFPAVLGGLYYLFGAHPLSGFALNWAAHALLVVTVAATAKRLTLPVARSAWIIAVFPPFLLWSGLLLREALTWWLLALIVFSLVSYAGSALPRQRLLYGAVFAASIASLFWVRGTAAVIAGVGGIAILLITSRRTNIVAHMALGAVLVILLIPRFGDLVDDYFPQSGPPTSVTEGGDTPTRPTPLDGTGDQDPQLDRLVEIRESLARDSTTSFTTPGSAGGSSLVTNATRVVLGPFPWEWSRVGAPFALDGLLWLGILAATVVGTWRSRRRFRLVLIALVPAALLLGALVVTSGNYGTMQRLRVQSAVLMVPVAAVGMNRHRREGHDADGKGNAESGVQ